MAGKPLAKVLKRLRKEDIAGNTAPNKKTISMSATRDGTALAPTGVAFRESVLAECGPDPRAYAAKKTAELETLGYGERPYKLEMSLTLERDEDFVDAFLGLKKDIPATDIKTWHSRFGLEKLLREHSDTDGTISIQPTAMDTCTITARSEPLSVPAVFVGQVYAPAIPGLPTDRMKLLIQTNLFQFTFKRSNWTISTSPPHPPQTLSNWAAYWRFASMLARGVGTIQIVAEKAPINSVLTVTAKLSDLDPDYCDWFCGLCEKAAALCKLAGVNHEPVVSIEQIVDSASQINSASLLTTPGERLAPASILTESVPGITPPYTTEMIYIDYLQLGDVTLGYYGRSRATGKAVEDKIEWNSDNVMLQKFVLLHQLPVDYEELARLAQLDIENALVWRREYRVDEEVSDDAIGKPVVMRTCPATEAGAE